MRSLKPNMYIFTTTFPDERSGEIWLLQELQIIHLFFNKIYIYPEIDTFTPVKIPSNCNAQANINASSLNQQLSLKDYVTIMRIVFTDLRKLMFKNKALKKVLYNASLVKMLVKRAKYISWQIEPNAIVYSYWADNGATLASILKMMRSDINVYTRAHGFEIYDDLKDDKFIPFRDFQNKYIDRFFSVSKRGMNYLKQSYPKYSEKYYYSYLGTKDYGMGFFEPGSEFTIVTCCYLNPIKRLELMAPILALLPGKLTWHVIGDGPEMHVIKEANAILDERIQVIYHRKLSNNKVLEFYKSTHINLFISLSYSEGLPVSMMEVQSFGIPILSTNVGGCNEICNETTGILIARDFNNEEVARKISDFQVSDKNTENFRLQCRQHWLTNFSAPTNYLDFITHLTK